jgi:hypothetical protein
MPTLQFFGWWRPPGAAAVSSGSLTAGRLTARLTLTARDLDQPSDAATRNVAYDLFGPGDVTGLGRGAVVHTYPSPGADNVEVEKAVYAELAAPDLPWRHSVVLPQGKALRPWIVLLVGSLLASVIGTTGASVLTIRPLLRTNAQRKNTAHLGPFFILAVANSGGLLTPLGDPPLLVGFVNGVPFFWTLKLFPIWLLYNLSFALFLYIVDRRAYAREPKEALRRDDAEQVPLVVKGKRNLALLGAIVLYALGAVDGAAVLEAIDFPTIIVLFGLMIL